MKTITLNFSVPDEGDYPSETLALVKTMLLDCLQMEMDHGHFDHTQAEGQKPLAEALLTES